MSTLPTPVIKQTLVYKVYGDIDQNEGRSGLYVVGYFTNYNLAQNAADGRGVMGTMGNIETLSADVVVYHDGDKLVTRILGAEVNESYESREKVRARALDKLTDDEKSALGLK